MYLGQTLLKDYFNLKKIMRLNFKIKKHLK